MKTFVYIAIILIILIYKGFTLYLSYLNHKSRKSSLPLGFEDLYDEEEYKKFQNYHGDNFKLNFRFLIIETLVLLILLVSGFFVWVNQIAIDLTDNLAIQFLIVLFAYYLVFFIVSLFSKYQSSFFVEEKYGFNKTTKKLFIIDRIKEFFFTCLLIGGAFYGVFMLYLKAGKLFFILTWAGMIFIMILVNLIYTSVIVPVFNKLTPLEDSSLRTKINEFATSVGYNVKKISVMDASKRSTKLNAFFSGFGKTKRIVLYDTLVEKLTEEEIVAVLAHEIGHNKHKHIIFNLLQSVILSSVYILGIMLFFNLEIISEAYGFSGINYGFNLIIYFILLEPVMLVLNLFMMKISRTFEYQADAFAANNYDANFMKNGLKALAKENFSNLTPHPLYVKFYYSHPPLPDRISHIDQLKKDES
jgi:STE24 endopeptidase